MGELLARCATYALLVAAWSAVSSCVPPPRMCAQESDCGAQASCVAGRCVAHGATPAIDSARRLLFAPVDVGYVRRGDGARDASLATLGRAGEPSIVFLRFSVPLAPEAGVLEAYVLLQRATSVDADPVPIALHAARVVTAWDGRTLSWATQPQVEEVGSPVTRISPGGGPLVRIDVRDLVQRWRKRGRDELGLALVTEGESVTGVAFALLPVEDARDRDDPVLSPLASLPVSSPFESRAAAPDALGDPRRQLGGPQLELYVK
ncbi:MAG TPA: DNRLRE domain-containing protein [Polyangiaceae bacterium]|jgi:hypothetical protein